MRNLHDTEAELVIFEAWGPDAEHSGLPAVPVSCVEARLPRSRPRRRRECRRRCTGGSRAAPDDPDLARPASGTPHRMVRS